MLCIYNLVDAFFPLLYYVLNKRVVAFMCEMWAPSHVPSLYCCAVCPKIYIMVYYYYIMVKSLVVSKCIMLFSDVFISGLIKVCSLLCCQECTEHKGKVFRDLFLKLHKLATSLIL